MIENSDNLDLVACLRGARRCMLGLVCLLAINFSLVALALAGFGKGRTERPPEVAAATKQQSAVVAPVVAAPVVASHVAIQRPAAESTAVTPPAATAPEPPPPTTPVDPAAESLILVNPAATGGAVHFAVDDVVYHLAPGQYCVLAGSRERRVAYHRGDDFGYAAHRLERGTHAFAIDSSGWTLEAIEPADSRDLLSASTPKPQ